jgi:hypothetical protein
MKGNKLIIPFMAMSAILSVLIIWALFSKEAAEEDVSVFKEEKVASTTMEDRMKELERVSGVLVHRTWLLGLANNENATHSKNLHKTLGQSDPGYIIFNEEWKMNKRPSKLKISESWEKELDSSIAN